MTAPRRSPSALALLASATVMTILVPAAAGAPAPVTRAATLSGSSGSISADQHHDRLPSLKAVPVPQIGVPGSQASPMSFLPRPGAADAEAGATVRGRSGRAAPPAPATARPPATATRSFTADPPTLPTRNYEGPSSVEAEVVTDLAGNVADASVAAGPTHLLALAGGTVSALAKATGGFAFGPAPTNSLWSGFAGACSTSSPSTARTLYDERAGRFVVVAPLDAAPPAAGALCVAVSLTSDPTGAWSRYSFALPAGTNLDQVALAAWADSFVVTARRSEAVAPDDSSGPDEAVGAGRPYLGALQRAPMLTGAGALIAQLDTSTTDSTLTRLTPVDLDTPPASGDGAALLAAVPESAASSTVQFFRLATDWVAPAATFSAAGTVGIAPADVSGTESVCGATCTDVQLGLSNASSYRATGPASGRATLGLTERGTVAGGLHIRYLTVDLDGGGIPSLASTGSLDNSDNVERFHPIVTADAAGDLSIAYNAIDNDLSGIPSLRTTGRATTDPPGDLRPEVDIAEPLLATEAPSPEPISNVLDPSDGCTAWVAGGYTSDLSAEGWSTRIASLPLPGCATSPSGTPVVGFAVSPRSGKAPLPVTATVTAPAGDGATYDWTFGDGATASGTFAGHTYTAAGVYRVVLDVGLDANHAVRSRLVAVGLDTLPVASDDDLSTKPNTPGLIDVIENLSGKRNDFDPDGGVVTLVSNTAAANGSVNCGAGGSCTYTPNAAYTGPDSFTYTIEDDEGDTATATVRIKVVDRPPFADDDGLVTGQNSPGFVNVLENDLDLDPTDTISFVSNTAALHGTVSCVGSGDCEYTPASNYLGEDRFDYTITDGELQATSFVDILVTECPDLSHALDPGGTLITGYDWVECASPDSSAATALAASGMDNDGELGLMTSGLADNAAPPNDETSTTGDLGTEVRGAFDVSILELNLNIPAGATCLAFDAVFASEEFPEFVGQVYNDAFLAELDTNDWAVSGQTISAPSNFAKDSAGRVLSVNSVLFSNVVTNNGTEYDGATPPLRIQTPITAGVHDLYLSIFDASDAVLDSGVFIDNMAAGTGPPGSCEAGTNQSPQINGDSATVREDAPTTIAVLGNDTDADGTINPSSLQVMSAPSHGVAVVQSGAVRYTPTNNYNGPDSFSYRACDNQNACANANVQVTVTPVADDGDFDGNGTTDVAVYRPSNGNWYVQGGLSAGWGAAGDLPFPGDYDGNGTIDLTVYRPSTGRWFVLNASGAVWGATGDIPVPADYDGNGSTDIAVYRPSTGQWFVRGGVTAVWGTGDDVPVPADFDGNGSTDIAVYRPSTGQWFVRGGLTTVWGLSTDVPVPGDFDGNGTTDVAVYRPSSGQWFVQNGLSVVWGITGDIPVAWDYDGNGTTDVAVYRPSTGRWFVRGGLTTVWGISTDVPLPMTYAVRKQFL